MPTQNAGMPEAEQRHRPGSRGRRAPSAPAAARTASGTAISTDITVAAARAATASAGSRSLISVPTSSCRTASVPRSPCTSRPRIVGVLLPQRLVEAPLVVQRGDRAGGGVHAQHRPRRVARDQVDHEEARSA